MSGHTIDHLVVMANQIGDFFAPMKDHKKSLDEIAGHLKRAWDPRMRVALMDHVEHHGGTGLSDIVLEAIKTHKMV